MPNNFTYNRDIPFDDDDPSVDQPDMKENTNNIDDLIAVDHVSFNTNKGGIHNTVRMPDQTGNTPISLGDGNGVLYGLTANGDTWPIWRNLTSGLSDGTFLFTGTTTALATGSTFVTGGIEIKWGQIIPVTLNASTAYSYPVAFKNNTFRVLLHPAVTTGIPATPQQVYVVSLNGAGGKTGFNYLTTPSSGGTTISAINYIAIGN